MENNSASGASKANKQVLTQRVAGIAGIRLQEASDFSRDGWAFLSGEESRCGRGPCSTLVIRSCRFNIPLTNALRLAGRVRSSDRGIEKLVCSVGDQGWLFGLDEMP